MGLFDIVSFLTPFFSGHGVPHLAAEADKWFAEKGQDYPDLRDRTEALAAFLRGEVEKAGLDAAKMKDTLWGLASDVSNGRGGVDKQAWQGGV